VERVVLKRVGKTSAALPPDYLALSATSHRLRRSRSTFDAREWINNPTPALHSRALLLEISLQRCFAYKFFVMPDAAFRFLLQSFQATR
jgi:hypothetical protein